MMRGRNNAKHLPIVEAIRSQIVSGVYRPGVRLPNRLEFGDQFEVGISTVQRALDTLMEDGFVHARAGTGTFVVDYPPHLFNIALVFPRRETTSRFFTAILEAGRRLSEQNLRRFVPYTISSDVRDRGDWPSLVDHVLNHRLAGMIFVFTPDDAANSPVLLERGIPRVQISNSSSVDLPCVTFDVPGFTLRALDELRRRGCRRIAHLYIDESPYMSPELFTRQMMSLGLQAKPYWYQATGFGVGSAAIANQVNLLMQLEGDKRPDGLIIHDDNLIEPATAGLLAAGIRDVADLPVVAHANFPIPIEGEVPLIHLGFDAVEMIQACLDNLAIQSKGETPLELTTLTARFAHETKEQPIATEIQS